MSLSDRRLPQSPKSVMPNEVAEAEKVHDPKRATVDFQKGASWDGKRLVFEYLNKEHIANQEQIMYSAGFAIAKAGTSGGTCVVSLPNPSHKEHDI